jgi:protein-disulfide isomerase
MWHRTVCLLAAAHIFTAAAPAAAQPSTGPPGESRRVNVLVRVDGESITATEVDEAVAGQLEALNAEIYQLRLQRIHAIIDARLVAREAARRGQSREALLDHEVTAKAGVVSDEEVARYLTDNQARLGASSPTVADQVRRLLLQRKRDARTEQFLAELRASANIEILLAPPTVARVELSSIGAYALGRDDAPVTIVAFTDFHCPYCQRAEPTLELVLAKYGNRVRVVHRDFPIDALHPEARRAHEAARCAGAQGAFWEYRDALFEGPPAKTLDQLTSIAGRLGLSLESFARCVQEATFSKAVQLDVAEGHRAGVTATPTFFINGRRLQGARSLGSFSQIIEEEVTRAAKDKGGAPMLDSARQKQK